LFGSASTVCPDCQRGHTIWVYIEYGKGGWYSEVPAVEDVEIIVPKSLLHASPTDLMNEVAHDISISQEKRVPIQEPSE
jgi:hypothetical protein